MGDNTQNSEQEIFYHNEGHLMNLDTTENET